MFQVVSLSATLLFCLLVTTEAVRAAEADGAELFSRSRPAPQSFHVRATSALFPDLTADFWQQGDTWRQQWIEERPEYGPRLIFLAAGKGKKRLLGRPEEDPAPLSLATLWLHAGNDLLVSLGVDVKQRSNRFYNRRPVVVLGATNSRQASPQAWFDRETGALLRLLLPGCDIQWEDYVLMGGFVLPTKVRIISGGVEEYLFSLAWRSVNVPLQKGLFTLEEQETSVLSVPLFPSRPIALKPLFDSLPQAASASNAAVR